MSWVRGKFEYHFQFLSVCQKCRFFCNIVIYLGFCNLMAEIKVNMGGILYEINRWEAKKEPIKAGVLKKEKLSYEKV